MMKTLNIVLLGTFLASSFAVNASADNRHSDRFQYRIYDEHVGKHQRRINQEKLAHHHRQKTYDESASNGHSKRYSKKHSKKRSNRYSKGHANNNAGYAERRNNDHHDKRHNHAQKQSRWETFGSFRGRSGKHVTRQIHVDERVKALSLQGTKRGMVVRRAHALLGNGRWVRIEGLEGHLRYGEQTKHRLRRPRHVQKVVLDIAPDRYKRGYADLRIKSASRKH